MTYELQHSDIDQPKLLDADPVTDKWPLPPVKRWAPVSGFDLDAICREAERSICAFINMRADIHWRAHRRGAYPITMKKAISFRDADDNQVGAVWASE